MSEVITNLDTIRRWQEHLNDLEAFQVASAWADTKILVEIGESRFWLKLYRGRIIDVMEYLPVSNALGYDVVVKGSDDAWAALRTGTKSWESLSTGAISIDGNVIEGNRLHEALCILLESIGNVAKEPLNV